MRITYTNVLEPTEPVLTLGLHTLVYSIIPLAGVSPFRIIGGHVSLNLPLNSSALLVASQITEGAGIQHAAIMEPTKILDGNVESLYQMDLGATINGTNPITGKLDSVSAFTDLLLWNVDQPMEFSDDNVITVTLIFQGTRQDPKFA